MLKSRARLAVHSVPMRLVRRMVELLTPGVVHIALLSAGSAPSGSALVARQLVA
jgi:hypothetical protein